MKHIEIRVDVFLLVAFFWGIMASLFVETCRVPFTNIIKFDMCASVVLAIFGIAWRRWYRRQVRAGRELEMRDHVRREEIRQDWRETR